MERHNPQVRNEVGVRLVQFPGEPLPALNVVKFA
jgi:hypothetical protein